MHKQLWKWFKNATQLKVTVSIAKAKSEFEHKVREKRACLTLQRIQQSLHLKAEMLAFKHWHNIVRLEGLGSDVHQELSMKTCLKIARHKNELKNDLKTLYAQNR